MTTTQTTRRADLVRLRIEHAREDLHRRVEEAAAQGVEESVRALMDTVAEIRAERT